MKIIKKSNFRVVIEPKDLGDYGVFRVSDSYFYKTDEEIQKKYEERCEEILHDVMRHVDNVGNVYIECDRDEVCSHCGYGWETDETGEPLCCNKAIEEFKAEKQKETQ